MSFCLRRLLFEYHTALGPHHSQMMTSAQSLSRSDSWTSWW